MRLWILTFLMIIAPHLSVAQAEPVLCQDMFVTPSALTLEVPGKRERLLPYVYHKEILDNPKIPDRIRQSVLQSLAFVERTFSGMKNVMASHLTSFIRVTGARRVIEVGSGSGYGLHHLTEDPSFHDTQFVLTDLYPDLRRWERLTKDRDNLGVVETSVDMTNLGETLPVRAGEPIILLNTISLHHLPDPLVRRYFESAERIGAHIMIVEIDRTVENLALTSAAAVPALLAPFSRGLNIRERLNIMLWGWFVPVMPVIYVHDSVMSTLRQRTESEWRALFRGLNFDVKYSYGRGPLRNFSVIEATNRGAAATPPFQ